MKRIVTLALALLFTLAFAGAALADAQFTASEKTLVTTPGEKNAWFFAKVENTGDTGAYVDGGSLVGFDSGDNLLFTESNVSTMPYGIWLEPGESAYLREWIYDDVLTTTTVADYKFSVKPDDWGSKYTALACEAGAFTTDPTSWSNYANVTFTNTTDDVLYNYTIVVAAHDTNGNLVFVNSDTNYSVGVHPGSTVTVRVSIDSDLVTWYAANSITIADVDARVYVEQQ